MGTVNVVLGEDTRLNLILGQQLENAVTSVVFDFSAWQTTYGSGTLALSVQRPGDDQPYAVALTTSGTDATWSVTNLDTAYKGVGHIQLTYTVGSAIKKSVVYKFTVYESLGANGEYPSPGQTWQEGIEDDIEGLRTDVDADHDELIDIREGADGVTYPSAGDAVRGQITDLKADFTEFDTEINQIINNLDDGKRLFDYTWGSINTDGSINYNYSPKVRIVTSDYAKMHANTRVYLESGYGLILALYNDDYSLYSRTIYAGGNNITIPSNKYFRACVYNGNVTPTAITDFADKLYYISNIQTQINNAIADINKLTNSGLQLTLVSSLDTIASSVMGQDASIGFYRYASNTETAPTTTSGYVVVYRAGTLYQAQIAIPVTGGYYMRNRVNGTWTAWQNMERNHVYKVEKNGSGDFTSLVEAINTATQFMDSVVYVGAGTWDIIDELGSAYVESVSSSQRGVYLKNRIHLIFASNSKVVCKYDGESENTQRWLSAFNAGEYGFTLENANIECENVRYCVHDERDSDADAYINKYINCKMYLNNSTNSIIRTCNPIGGGLGKNGYIDINGCWFKGEPTQVYLSQLPLVTYHNSAGADAKSHISVKNCYLHGDGRFRFNWYGQSQLITDVEVCGCSMGSSILSQAEVSGSSPYENINIIEWNNTIRT